MFKERKRSRVISRSNNNALEPGGPLASRPLGTLLDSMSDMLVWYRLSSRIHASHARNMVTTRRSRTMDVYETHKMVGGGGRSGRAKGCLSLKVDTFNAWIRVKGSEKEGWLMLCRHTTYKRKWMASLVGARVCSSFLCGICQQLSQRLSQRNFSHVCLLDAHHHIRISPKLFNVTCQFTNDVTPKVKANTLSAVGSLKD